MELSDYELNALSKDFCLRIKGLTKARKATKVGVAIEILDEGRRRGVANLAIYRAVLKVLCRLLSVTPGEVGVEQPTLCSCMFQV